jgi:hypothetical protein
MPHNALVTRLRAEFMEMPGLQLNLEQAQRLCGVERVQCQQVFDALVAEKFLFVKPDGTYARLTEGTVPRPRPVKADLRCEPNIRLEEEAAGQARSSGDRRLARALLWLAH